MKISKTGRWCGGAKCTTQPPPSSISTPQPISDQYFLFYRAGIAASYEHSKADFFLFPRWIQNIFMVFIDKVIDEKTVGLYYK